MPGAPLMLTCHRRPVSVSTSMTFRCGASKYRQCGCRCWPRRSSSRDPAAPTCPRRDRRRPRLAMGTGPRYTGHRPTAESCRPMAGCASQTSSPAPGSSSRYRRTARYEGGSVGKRSTPTYTHSSPVSGSTHTARPSPSAMHRSPDPSQPTTYTAPSLRIEMTISAPLGIISGLAQLAGSRMMTCSPR